MERQLAKRIWQLIEPVIVHAGYEVVDVEVHGARNSVVRIFLDGRGGLDGPSGITIDQCAQFARTISNLLDVEDPIVGRYTLEVSSPGLNRPLRKPAHFTKAIGEEVAAKVEHQGKVQKLRGILMEATDEAFALKPAAGEAQRVPYDTLVSAHVVYDFQNPSAPNQKRHATRGTTRQ